MKTSCPASAPGLAPLSAAQTSPRASWYHLPMALTAEYVISELEKHAEVLRGFGVKKIGLFGSVARGEGTPDSDLDFLVELERLTYRDYFCLLAFLQDLFIPGRVDLVTSTSVREELRPYIMQDILYAERI